MRVFRFAFAMMLPILFWQGAAASQQRMSYSDTKKTIDRIKDRSDRFADRFDDDLGRTEADSDTRDDIKRTVRRFEHAAERLEERYEDDNAAVSSVRDVLNQAALIDSFIASYTVSPRVQSDWAALKQDLNMLANSYGMRWEWPSALARAVSPPAAVIVIPIAPGSRELGNLIQDIQIDANAFQTSVRSALAGSSYERIETGPRINQHIGDFMVATDRLKASYTAGQSGVEAANEVLARGEAIDIYMRSHPLSVSAQQNWLRLRNDLIRLAAAYNLSPQWLR